MCLPLATGEGGRVASGRSFGEGGGVCFHFCLEGEHLRRIICQNLVWIEKSPSSDW